MNVLHVINSMGAGGAEQSLAEGVLPLRKHDIHVHIACLSFTDGRVGGMPVTVVGRQGRVRSVGHLRSLIRAISPKVIHTSLFEASLVGSVSAVGTGIPVVTSLVNTSYVPVRALDPNVQRWKLEAVRLTEGIAAHLLTDHFHAISASVKRAAVRYLWIDPQHITVIPRGRSEARLGTRSRERRRRVREGLGLTRSDQVLLSVGRQEYQKGHQHLLDAMPRLVGVHPSAQLLIAGREGKASEGMRQQREELRLEQHLSILGHREDVPDLLAAADVFVFPSLYEGLGGALIEAMALELPIVASDVPAIREVTDDGRCGILVPPADPRALAEAISELLDDPGQMRLLGQRGRAIFEERYRLGPVVEQMAQLYRRVAAMR